MATVIDETRGDGISIGRVLTTAFGTISANPLATLGIAFVFSALPGLLVGVATQSLRATTYTTAGASGMAFDALSAMTAGIIGLLVWLLCAVITQGALVRATVAHARGERASLGESALAGLRVLVPLILLSVVMVIAIGVAWLFFVVPGIMLYMAWAVASPALVAERIGIGASLSRSAHLTKGARWKVFGLQLIILVLYWMASAITTTLLFTIYGGVSALAVVARAGGFPILYYLVSGAVNMLMAAIWGCAQAALYVELAAWKDGPATDALAEIFA